MKTETINKSSQKKSSVSIFLGFLNGNRKYILLTAVFVLLNTLIVYLIPQITSFTIDVLLKEEPVKPYLSGIVNLLGGVEYIRRNLYIVAIILVIITILQSVTAYYRRIFILNGSERICKNIRDRMYGHIQTLPFSWHTSVSTGDIIQRATQDTDLIKRYISSQFIELFRVIIMMIIGLVIMFMMNVKMTFIALIYSPIIIFFSVAIFPKISKKFQSADEAEGILTAKLQENLSGIRVVRAFGRQSEEMAAFETKNNEYTSLWIKFSKTLSLFWASGDFFAGLQTLTVLIMGTFMVVGNEITLGELIAFIAYNQMLIWPIRNIGKILAETGKALISTKRLDEVLSVQPENYGHDENPDFKINGAIEFKNVSFSYDVIDSETDVRKILEGVSFNIPLGSTFGIIGGTGSGKSTIASLINRLYDISEGEILIDGTNIENIDRAYLRKNVGLILQEPFLFSRTIKDNITIGAASFDETELNKYISIASLEDTIGELQDGLDTMVGEKGVTLSGGQKQRVVIARTLIQKPPIVIFDDSLSAVDTETDFKIREALKQSLGGATVILISHRISSLMHADKIMVLNNGKVEDIGTHAELIKREGTYRRLYDLQAKFEND